MKLRSFVILVLAAGCLYGCGGTNSVSSPFQGSYQGNWNATNVNDAGTVQMSVDEFGDVSGQLSSTADGTNPFTGNIQDNGDVTGDLNVNGHDDPFGGNLQFDQSGNLSGQVNFTTPYGPDGVVRVDMTLTPTSGGRRRRRG